MNRKRINKKILTILIVSAIMTMSSLVFTVIRLSDSTMHSMSVFICAINFSAMATMTISITGCMLERTSDTEPTALFIRFLFSIIRAMFYIFMSIMLNGIKFPHYIGVNYILRSLNFLVRISMIISFVRYIRVLFPNILKEIKYYLYFLYFYDGVLLILLLLNFKYDIIFTYTEKGFERQGFANFTFFIPLIMMIGLIPYYLFKKIDRFTKITIVLYLSLPVICSFLQIIVLNFDFSSIGSFISACILYVHTHLRQQMLVQEQQYELQKHKTAIMLSQIQPHFLYNSLSSIASLCMKDPQKAKKTTITFTRYLRSNINSLSSPNLIPFNSEYSHTMAYLEIEQIRFPKRLRFETDIKATDFSIPPLTLQPIVENAVKHGICKKEEGGTVKISTYETDGSFVVSVSDDGVGFETDKEELSDKIHIGIENVKHRVNCMANGNVIIESKKDVGTTVKIILPKEK